jgi:GNAT superfamily N-acetyltransferase
VPPDVPATGDVRIRPMRSDDAVEVGRLTLAGYDAYGFIGGAYRDELGDPVRRLGGATAVLVAELDGRIVGTVTYVLPGDEQWEGRPVPEGDCGFRVLAVDPSAEGRGVGRRLVERCIDRARAEGRHRLVITSMEWMTRAHGLYERLGFVRRPDLDVRFPSGIGVVYTLDLTPEAPRRFPAPGPLPAEPPWYEDAWVLH